MWKNLLYSLVFTLILIVWWAIIQGDKQIDSKILIAGVAGIVCITSVFLTLVVLSR